MLLVGVCQRPHPSKKFWQFIIYWIEFTIILKYLFEFDVFSFNRECGPQPDPASTSIVIGIDKSCGSLFVDLITELAVLITCVVHRGMMRRVGLWRFFREMDDLDNIIAEEADETVSPVIKVSTESMEQTDDISLIGYAVKPDSDAAAKAAKAATELSSSSHKVQTTREHTPTKDLIIDWETKKVDESFFTRQWHSSKSHAKHFLDTSHLPGYDYYVAIFIADFTVFILTLIFWSSFSGDNSTNLQFLYAVFQQNSVPPLFVAILLVNFCLIIADRMVYISKSLLAKLAIQWITVIAFTMWIFFVLPPSNKYDICLWLLSVNNTHM